MSPGAQSVGHVCSPLIQRVVQSTEPEAKVKYYSTQLNSTLINTQKEKGEVR